MGWPRLLGLIACLTAAVAAAPARAGVAAGHSGWSWADPQPQGHDLYALGVSGSTAYAVGDYGTVLRSADGGATWTGLTTPTLASLLTVQVPDPDAVVAGGACSVIESVDGGARFVDTPVPSCTGTVSSLAFPDQQTGYVELSDGTMLFTDDGSHTLVPRARAPGPAQRTPPGLAFSSVSDGLEVSGDESSGGDGTIERSTDGARSWSQVGGSPNDLTAVTFADPTTAYAVGDSDTMLQSTDGGATWVTRSLTLPTGTPHVDLSQISCSSATVCLITTDDGRLVRTTDGGLTGTVISASGQVLRAAVGSPPAAVLAVGDAGTIERSADGGATFTPSSASLALRPGGTGEYVEPGGASGYAYVPGSAGEIEATHDSGADWSPLRVPTRQSIDNAYFTTAAIGYAVDVGNRLYRTADGGAHWQRLVRLPAGASLIASGAHNVLALGPRGARRSLDGGRHFAAIRATVTLPSGRRPVATLRVSRAGAVGHGIIALSGNRLLSATPDARHWMALGPIPGNAGAVLNFDFFTRSTGYLVTVRLGLLFTRDAGRHWTPVAAVGADVDGSISFSSPRDGFVGISGRSDQEEVYGSRFGDFDEVDVMHTADGGRTWQPEVIDGYAEGSVSATPTVDYWADGGYVSVSAARPRDLQIPGTTVNLLTTTDGGASPEPSQLTLALGAHRLSASRLRRSGGRLAVTGRLAPARPGLILIADRPAGGLWHEQSAVLSADGTYRATLHNLTRSSDIVAFALGDGRNGGAGTPAQRLTVTGGESTGR
jgi:photosystem II stability/assembly factor-like uncharacterized protein